MLRLPVRSRASRNLGIRLKSSSSFIRSSFIEYFVEKHGHKHVKSSSVVPLCDPTVPFVNAGMNQFKGVFLGTVDPPCSRAVNSQKCVRVGGKHNDLEVVGTDGHHHTFFEMLGNWSFGDYYKKEACQMAWDLLLGPYRLKPENLVVTYFSGDIIIGLKEDRECRDIWRAIGVPDSRLKGMGAADNFWEMGATGPCGPCTEIHYVNPDGSLTEIWNLVFIQCHRQQDGQVKGLRRHHVDTGMGLERMAALLQGVPSNYDTDLFHPIIKAIEKNSKGTCPYGGRYGGEAGADAAYRRLADHARMISVCLADDVFPATSLNLRQIMRKSFKISTDIFQNPNLLHLLYDEVASTLGSTYPELITKMSQAKLIIEHERDSYARMRSALVKKWKNLVMEYPEVEVMSDVELGGFALGYKEFKETMSKQKSTVIPGELVFKLYDTHGFQEDVIDRIAHINNLGIDKEGFKKLLTQHKSRHKTAFKEQSSNKGVLFNETIEKLIKSGVRSTNDQHKYDYSLVDNKIVFKPLKTELIAILNEDSEWIDILDPSEDRPNYLVTKDTNFYCEEGGQIADTGTIRLNNNVTFTVESVFKIRDFVFHLGFFNLNRDSENNYVKCNSDVILEIDEDRRLNIMRNHTGVHLLNAAIRRVLPNSVVCQIGSSVTDKGLHLNLSVYGEKLSQEKVLEAQELIRESIKCNAEIDTRVVTSMQLSEEPAVLTVPGETYPEVGLRLVTAQPPLLSKELCCGTHVPSAGLVRQLCVTHVRGAGGHTPTIHALTGDIAQEVSNASPVCVRRELCCGTHVPSAGLVRQLCVTHVRGAGGHTPTIHALTGDIAQEARELFCRAQKLEQVIDLIDPIRKQEELKEIKSALTELCGAGGAPYAEYKQCLALLDNLQKRPVDENDMALHAIAEAEVAETIAQAAREGRKFVVHFLRCSYLMQSEGVSLALGAGVPTPALLVGCAGGVIIAACRVPQDMVTDSFTAKRWLSCILPVFHADVLPTRPQHSPHTYAEMTATKVSLINCEQLVQDAMRVAIKFAQAHVRDVPDTDARGGTPSQKRQHN